MNNIIVVKKLCCKFHDKEVLNNINFDIKEGDFVSIVGSNGSGKSTLIKVLLGIIPYEGYISFNNATVCKNNIDIIRKSVGVIFENPDNSFVIDTVKDELIFTLENLNWSLENIKVHFDYIVNYLKITYLLDKNVSQLSYGEKQLVSIASVLITEPKVLIIDKALEMIDGESHKLVLNLIRKLNKEKKITVINATNEVNDTIYSDEILVLQNGKLVLDGSKEEVYEQDKKLKAAGVTLPFIVDLSKKLGYYGLIDKIIYSDNVMVKQLWK